MMKTSLGLQVEQRQQVVADGGVALELGAAQHRDVAAAAQHESAQRNAVGGDQPAGAAGDLHREGFRMAGAEGLHYAAGLEGVGDQPQRRRRSAAFGRRKAVEPRRDFVQILARSDRS